MLRFLQRSNIIRGRLAAGIYAYFNSNGECEYNFILLKRKRTNIEIIGKGESIASINDLANHIPAAAPVCLAIDGKGAIHKKMLLKPDDTPTDLLHYILPNANSSEFLIQQTPAADGKTFISIARNNNIQQILTRFTAIRRYIVSICLGPFTLNHIIRSLNGSPSVIIAGDYKLLIENGTINDLQAKETGEIQLLYKAGDDELYGNTLIPYSAALKYFIDDEPALEHVTEQAQEFYYKRFFLTSGKIMLAFIFIMLLGNFILFNRYYKRSEILSAMVGQNRDMLLRFDTLKAELKKKQEFIAGTGFLEVSRQSYYADMLAGSLPEKIILTKMEISPLDKKLKQEETPVFFRDIIRLSGITPGSAILNEWIKTLKKFNWIKDITVVNYNQESNTAPGSFEIEIKIY
ncbi:MAG: hypothetical protein HY738_07490 [Bacteroidia bacterium]|nr:hypothetical protein [Bacteroidia bacterium]